LLEGISGSKTSGLMALVIVDSCGLVLRLLSGSGSTTEAIG